MQLGMIGLGRMGANIVRRLMRDGHECVVYDVNADAIAELEGEGATGARSLEEMAQKLAAPRAVWIMVPAAYAGATAEDVGPAPRVGRHDHRRRQLVLPRRHRPGEGLRRARHPLPRRRHQRRRVRPGARLLHDDRRRHRGRRSGSTRSSARSPPGVEAAERTPGRTGDPVQPELGYLHCGPPGAGHFVKMVHNGIEYGIMAAYAEGLGILHKANVGNAEQVHDAETTPAPRPGDVPVRHRHGRRRRGVAPRLGHLLVAARPHRDRPQRGPGRWRSSAAASPTRARAAGPSPRPWTRASPPTS